MAVTIVIPSLDPDEKLAGVVNDLVEAGFTDILLVDDGSDEAHQAPFAQLEQLPQVTVLHHPKNLGKGRALKTAFSYVLAHRPDHTGVVTVDGDGQHGTQDVCRIAQALEQQPAVWLGARDFNDPAVPGRSRFGNKASCLTMRLLCGLRIADTQTGLRGIPMTYLSAFLEVAGERFEYETNMLLELRHQNMPYRELFIDTIYIDENKSSHFRPLMDGWRVYRLMLGFFVRYMGSSLFSGGLDLLLFTLLLLGLGGVQESVRILLATALARVASSFVNFLLNRRVVFHSAARLPATLWRYYLVCTCQMLVSAGVVALLSAWLPLPATVIKCVVDVCLFLIGFQVQQRFVFANKET